jgi:hypothetical protein
MSKEFFLRHPRKNISEHVRWRIATRTRKYAHGVRPSSHRLTQQLGCLGRSCLQIAIVVGVSTLLAACIITYLLLLARNR